jgi:mevalonate kinase
MGHKVSASGKIILLGEHAVVYGKPAIAVPLSALRANAEIIPSVPNSGLKITAVDLGNREFVVDAHSAQSQDPLVVAAWMLLSDLNCPPPDAHVILHSDIPLASGMGSGAAVTTALFRALGYLVGKPLPDARMNDLVYEIEKIYHGTPSGIDNTVIVFEQPIYFVRGNPIEHLIITQPLTLLVANTGIAASTKIAVGDVRTLYETNRSSTAKVLDTIADLVVTGRTALEQGDHHTLGKVMSENHKLLQQLTVSSPLLDKLVTVARNAGAFGAKLSGGGRGGNMIALVSEDRASFIKAQLLEAGAVKVYQTVVS